MTVFQVHGWSLSLSSSTSNVLTPPIQIQHFIRSEGGKSQDVLEVHKILTGSFYKWLSLESVILLCVVCSGLITVPYSHSLC